MVPAGLLLILVQAAACTGDGGRLHTEGAHAAAQLDLATAVQRFEASAALGCADARMAAIYVPAIAAARDAYRLGGSEESLRPVRRAETELATLATQGDRLAAIGQLLVMAAAAAAQSERGEMALLLEQAQTLERARIEGGLGAVPGISAHELAGDLWLQVHRFDTARAAYRQALALAGPTPRALLGLARTAVRLGDAQAACDGYTHLLREWKAPDTVAELIEARLYLGRQCPR